MDGEPQSATKRTDEESLMRLPLDKNAEFEFNFTLICHKLYFSQF